MSNKQDYPSGYMDEVRVKISEKYKPPPRIGLPMSYAQRLTLNKQIQDSIPQYEFVLEKTVKEKMVEWRSARTVMYEELKTRLEKARSDEKKKAQETLEFQKQLKEEEAELTQAQSSVAATTSGYQSAPPNALYLNSGPSQSFCTSTQSMLIPTQVNTNTYSNILTPIPLKEHSGQNFQLVDKSPFNISDFEEDTSSPFDNMELKSINDMEELAQVLKREPTYQDGSPLMANYGSTGVSQHNYFPVTGSNYTYTIPNSTPYIHPVTSVYNRNGYYFPPETIPANRSFNSPYSYSNHLEANYGSLPVSEVQSSRQATSVPDILKSLNAKLGSTHIDNVRPTVVNNTVVQVDKSTDMVYPKVKTKSEELDDPYTSLTKSTQEVCQSISSMGFPLSRVARVCKVVGNDQKKIVDHLLAMSELLVLGFPEPNVSKALVQCDNDRDRALDLLTL